MNDRYALPFGLDALDAIVHPVGFSEAKVFIFADRVLKWTPATASDFGVERARRELNFMRTLAGGLPIRTPAFLEWDDGAGVAMLLERVPRSQPPEDYVLHVARDLARLHSHFRGSALPLGPEPAVPSDRESARRSWSAQQHLDPESLARTMALLDADLPEDDTDPTVLHGDAHAGNALWTGVDIAWIDWSAARRGPRVQDLSFFLQRDQPSGKHPSEAEAFAAYAGSAVSEALRLAHIYELRTRLIEWPHYFPYIGQDAVTGLMQRILDLADELGLRW